MKSYLLFTSLLWINLVALAQSSINYPKIKIPVFKCDTSQSLVNREVKLGVIYPIDQSTADLEIRFYSHYQTPYVGRILVIKCILDTIKAQVYLYTVSAIPASKVGNDEYIGHSVDGEYVYRSITDITPLKSWIEIFQQFERNHLYSLPTESEVFKKYSLKYGNFKNEYFLNTQGGLNIYEIKSGNRIRNFQYHSIANLSAITPSIKELKEFYYSNELLKLFNEIEKLK